DGLIAILGLLDALLEPVRAVEALPGDGADHRQHRHRDHHLEQREAPGHSLDPVPGETTGVVPCTPWVGVASCWVPCVCPTVSGRMTIICEAETSCRCLPSCQLTLRRTSRTLFFSVSMKVVACEVSTPPSGPASMAAPAPPCRPCSAPCAPPIAAASEEAAPEMPEVLPPPPVAPPIRFINCAGSSFTSGLRISALQA